MKTNFLFGILIYTIIFSSCEEKEKNWRAIPTEIQEDIHDVEVIDDHNAYAYSYGTGNLYKTENGGTNWKNIYQFDSVYFEQLQFINKNLGWICGSPNKIFKTTNSGLNWNDISIKSISEKALIYGMYFKDKIKGYVAIMQVIDKKRVTLIYQTKDGGGTWELVNTIDEMVLNIEEINGTIYGTGNNVIIKDIDKKDAWSFSFKDENKKVGQIRDLAYDGEEKLLGVSFNGYVLEKNENGWSTQKITNNRIRNLVNVEDENWIAVGDGNKEAGKLYFSVDNGNSWKTDKNEYPDIHKINLTENYVWAVGKMGLVMKRNR